MHNPGGRNMDSRDLSGPVLKLVNLARASYGAFELETLLMGQPQNASFCLSAGHCAVEWKTGSSLRSAPNICGSGRWERSRSVSRRKL